MVPLVEYLSIIGSGDPVDATKTLPLPTRTWPSCDPESRLAMAEKTDREQFEVNFMILLALPPDPMEMYIFPAASASQPRGMDLKLHI